MSDDAIVVHQDTTLNATGKWSVVLGLGGITALLAAGIMIGKTQSKVETLQDDVRALRIEVQTRESKDAVALMFSDVRERLRRIESLLDNPTARRGQ